MMEETGRWENGLGIARPYRSRHWISPEVQCGVIRILKNAHSTLQRVLPLWGAFHMEDLTPQNYACAAVIRNPVDRYWSGAGTMHESYGLVDPPRPTAESQVLWLRNYLRENGHPYSFNTNPHVAPQAWFLMEAARPMDQLSLFRVEELDKFYDFLNERLVSLGNKEAVYVECHQNPGKPEWKEAVRRHVETRDLELLAEFYKKDMDLYESL